VRQGIACVIFMTWRVPGGDEDPYRRFGQWADCAKRGMRACLVFALFSWFASWFADISGRIFRSRPWLGRVCTCVGYGR
jgi:hypothetical protein